MDKELIDAEALARWLTDEIRKIPGCEKVSVKSVYKLLQPEPGCNWRPDFIIGHGFLWNDIFLLGNTEPLRGIQIGLKHS
jgi:hypothetical protein